MPQSVSTLAVAGTAQFQHENSRFRNSEPVDSSRCYSQMKNYR